MTTELKKILYVDDDEDILHIAKITLESFGHFDVHTCASASEALETTQTYHPDLILMDVMMPKMDGPAALKALRAQGVNTPIIFVTAKVQQSEINSYLNAGGIGVIKKPFDPASVCNEIQAIWQKAQSSPTAADNSLAQLKLAYLTHLKTYQAQIANALLLLNTKKMLDSTTQQTLQQVAHKLIGSGATYGFKALSKAAEDLELVLSNDSAEIIPALKKILDICANLEQQDNFSPTDTATDTTAALHILLVDDGDAIGTQLTELLPPNVRLTTSINPDEILELAKKREIDLLILNSHLRNIKSLQLLEKLQAIAPTAQLQILILIPENDVSQVMQFIMAGAVDYLTLPLQAETVHEKIVTRLEKINTTILIADDDVTIRELLAHKFRAMGCQVLQAKDGDEAHRIAQIKKPNLVILDYMMPGMDGGAVLQKMRNNEALKNVPVLFLTAKKQQENILAGLQQGAADYITKPFIPDEVILRCFKLLKDKSE